MSIAPMYFIQKKLHRCNLYNLISLRPMSVDCRGSSGEASSGGRNSPGCRPGVRPDEIPQPPIPADRQCGSAAEDHTGSGGISSTDRRKISFNSRKSSLWRIRSGAAEAVRGSRRSSRIAAPRENGNPAPRNYGVHCSESEIRSPGYSSRVGPCDSSSQKRSQKKRCSGGSSRAR